MADEIDLAFVDDVPGQPLAIATRTADTKLYVAEKGGLVYTIDGGATSAAPVLDISGGIDTQGERGLLGITFQPDGGAMFVYYSNRSGDSIVARYDMGPSGPDPTTKERIIKINQPSFENHKGGNLAFGPDGFLYIGLGDGGRQNDPGNRSQRKDTLIGKMLRIDPKADGGYKVPPSNPYVGRKGKNEIWARGFRNPWRWSFDDVGPGATGDLWIGDVGGGRREEIDHQLDSSPGGENYGWRRMEGTLPNIGKEPKNHTPPVYEYPHEDGNCSVTGGYVYRGSAIPALLGDYLFVDFCAGDIMALSPADHTARKIGDTEDTVTMPTTFGRDNGGELYIVSIEGAVFRIVEEGT